MTEAMRVKGTYHLFSRKESIKNKMSWRGNKHTVKKAVLCLGQMGHSVPTVCGLSGQSSASKFHCQVLVFTEQGMLGFQLTPKSETAPGQVLGKVPGLFYLELGTKVGSPPLVTPPRKGAYPGQLGGTMLPSYGAQWPLLSH